MKLAVVTYPASEETGPSLTRDVELIRASILYADEIELVSLGAVMLAGIAQLAESDESDIFSFISALDDATIRKLGGEGLTADQRAMLPAAMAALQLDPAHSELLRGVRDAAAELRLVVENMIITSGGRELLPAFDAGILKLSPSGFANDSNVDSAINGWIELLKSLLQDPTTRLLFDDRAGGLVRSLVDEGHVTPGQMTLKHAGEAAVGSGLIARLPALPQAPVDELLDLRRDLGSPLRRYRAAASRLADGLAFRTFDPESAVEIDDIWTREVAPTLLEIEEGFAEHKLVRETARTLGTDLKSLIREGAALYVGLGTLASVKEWIASTVAVAGPVAQAAAQAATKSSAAQRAMSSREFYYLYEVNQRL